MSSANASDMRVAGGLGGVDESLRGGHRLVMRAQPSVSAMPPALSWSIRARRGRLRARCGTTRHYRSGWPMLVKTAPNHGSKPRGTPSRVLRNERPGRLRCTGRPASIRPTIQHCVATTYKDAKPRMIDGTGGLDQLFGPGDRLIVLDHKPT